MHVHYKPTTEIGPNKLRIRLERVRHCMENQRRKLRLENSYLVPDLEVQPENVRCERDDTDGPCVSTTNSIPQHEQNVVPSTSQDRVVNVLPLVLVDYLPEYNTSLLIKLRNVFKEFVMIYYF